MNSTFDFYATPSFCNSWPLISVEVNGQECWHGYVEHPQTIAVEFELQEHNQIYIRYLNKNQGPTTWDTEIDSNGNILQDQYCIIKNIRVGKSRCDFLISDLVYHGDDGTADCDLLGFMSKKGYYFVEFPQDIYAWILEKRKEKIFHNPRRNSSLDYWTDYIGDNSHANVDKLLGEIKEILKKL
jgi:hypothetical protein